MAPPLLMEKSSKAAQAAVSTRAMLIGSGGCRGRRTMGAWGPVNPEQTNPLNLKRK